MQNAWVALNLRIDPLQHDLPGALHSVFAESDLLAAIAPLNCILMLESPSVLSDALRGLMPPSRVGFAINARTLQSDAEHKHLLALHDQGYKFHIDGPLPEGVSLPPTLRGVTGDFSENAPTHPALPQACGPHLAHGVNSTLRRDECANIGYEWFSGDYPLQPAPAAEQHDGSSRKRLMTLLGLLARDAETRDLEALLKQDPALSYHLLKLANSAAFAQSSPITSFGQAISVLGRRQLQRWLQLLLYARQQADGLPNLVLPIAALRGAQMEALCKLKGGERDEQDLAFMTGVFSLLDLLFAMPMDEIVGALSLPTPASQALLSRAGKFGEWLRIAESQRVSGPMLEDVGVTPAQWWRCQLHSYHWAIQVSRNF